MSISTETERKFLIALPEKTFLDALDFSEIVQTYLQSEKGVTERVRMRSKHGAVRYTHTKKVRISPMSSTENEREIEKSEYLSLLTRTDKARSPVYKTRYLLRENGFLFEIDVYPFWKKQAVMEVELPSEDTFVEMPREIRILCEVTGDHRYSNASIALAVPPEIQ